MGLGVRQVAALTTVAPSVVRNVRSGRVTTLRPSTLARLLAAPPSLARGALVAATKTWRAIDSLHREGYTSRELAFHLGAQSQQLQFAPRQVRVTSALRVQTLYERITT